MRHVQDDERSKPRFTPLELCKTILKGIKNHLTMTGLMHAGSVGVMTDAEEESIMNVDIDQSAGPFDGDWENKERMMSEATMQATAAAHRGAVNNKIGRAHV